MSLRYLQMLPDASRPVKPVTPVRAEVGTENKQVKRYLQRPRVLFVGIV
jgi:hypothetical protein